MSTVGPNAFPPAVNPTGVSRTFMLLTLSSSLKLHANKLVDVFRQVEDALLFLLFFVLHKADTHCSKQVNATCRLAEWTHTHKVPSVSYAQLVTLANERCQKARLLSSSSSMSPDDTGGKAYCLKPHTIFTPTKVLYIHNLKLDALTAMFAAWHGSKTLTSQCSTNQIVERHYLRHQRPYEFIVCVNRTYFFFPF